MSKEKKVAVVTGGNRGLGKEVCRQLADKGWWVVLTGRSLDNAKAAAEELNASVTGDGEVVAAALDVTADGQAQEVAGWVDKRWGRVDALVNNAGAIFEEGWPAASGADLDLVVKTLNTNAVGALRVTQAFGPMVQRDGGGNIVNVSSGMGGLKEMGGAHAGYRMSKAAMNAQTRIFHNEYEAVRVNSVCPGFVRTEITPGNANAPLSVEEGASGIVWAATLEEGGPSGGFFRKGEPIDW